MPRRGNCNSHCPPSFTFPCHCSTPSSPLPSPFTLPSACLLLLIGWQADSLHAPGFILLMDCQLPLRLAGCKRNVPPTAVPSTPPPRTCLSAWPYATVTASAAATDSSVEAHADVACAVCFSSSSCCCCFPLAAFLQLYFIFVFLRFFLFIVIFFPLSLLLLSCCCCCCCFCNCNCNRF